MTIGDHIIGWGYLVPAVAIAGILAFAVGAVVDGRRNAGVDARDDKAAAVLRERWGWRNLWGRPVEAQRIPGEQTVAAPLVRHRARRQLPDWIRTLATYGRTRKPSGYESPPPLQVVEEPTVSAWLAQDRNTVPSLLNPAVGAASVRRSNRWEELDVIGDVLGGRMRAAANSEDTGLLEPIRTEVVQ